MADDLPDPSISAFGRPRPFKHAWISRRKVEREVQKPSRWLVDGDNRNGWYVCREGFASVGWEWHPDCPYQPKYVVHALTVMWLGPA